MSVSVNVLTEAVAGPATLPRITEAGNRAARLRGLFGNAAQKIFCSSELWKMVIRQLKEIKNY
jgi:hypothetical protein